MLAPAVTVSFPSHRGGAVRRNDRGQAASCSQGMWTMPARQLIRAAQSHLIRRQQARAGPPSCGICRTRRADIFELLEAAASLPSAFFDVCDTGTSSLLRGYMWTLPYNCPVVHRPYITMTPSALHALFSTVRYSGGTSNVDVRRTTATSSFSSSASVLLTLARPTNIDRQRRMTALSWRRWQ